MTCRIHHVQFPLLPQTLDSAIVYYSARQPLRRWLQSVNRLRFDGRSIVVRLRLDVDWQSNSSQITSNRSRISRIAVVATA